jgi:prepilin-type N-terminal cleavage/methylation domain-containing protein
MRKIQSFTLIELLVAMLISAVVIGMASTIFINFQKHFIKISVENELSQTILFFESGLQKDFENGVLVTGGNDELQICMNNGNIIHYLFGDKSIIRTSGLFSDTIPLKAENVLVEYQFPIEKIINYIKINLKIQKAVVQVSVSKAYSKEFLFNKEAQEHVNRP